MKKSKTIKSILVGVISISMLGLMLVLPIQTGKTVINLHGLGTELEQFF